MIQTRDENPPVKHPLVPVHPVTGERSLYFSESFTAAILGLTKYESEGMHAMLTRHCAKPEFQYRLKWEKGTIAFWDNRTSLHYAVADYWPDTRIMHRLTIEGRRHRRPPGRRRRIGAASASHRAWSSIPPRSPRRSPPGGGRFRNPKGPLCRDNP